MNGIYGSSFLILFFLFKIMIRMLGCSHRRGANWGKFLPGLKRIQIGVLAFSLAAGCQVTGNPIPSTQHGSRVLEGCSGHLQCTPVLGRLRRTPNSRWFPGLTTPYGAHPSPLPVLSCQPYPLHSQPCMLSIPHNSGSLCIVWDIIRIRVLTGWLKWIPGALEYLPPRHLNHACAEILLTTGCYCRRNTPSVR